MKSDYLHNLKHAVQQAHGCKAKHFATFDVKFGMGSHTAFEGEVEAFDLQGHPTANRCYAWAYQDGDEFKATTALEIPPVVSALTAVMAAVGSEVRTK